MTASEVLSLSFLPTREGWGRVLPSLGQSRVMRSSDWGGHARRWAKGWGVGLLIFLLCLPMMVGAAKLRPLVWVLDAGHGGKDVGTESKRHQEKNITLEITKQVAALVRKNKPGIKLILTREKDTYVSLDRRCQIANQANADLFLSIHVNAVEKKPLLSGTESFYANTRFIRDAVLQSSHAKTIDRSELLAWLLQKNYRDAGRQAGRGAKPERLYVLSHTLMPAVLTEVGFLSNIEDEAYMTSKRGQKEIATCIYKALAEYYETTQAKTHKKTLTRLRNSNGKTSGLSTPKVAESLTPSPSPGRGEDLTRVAPGRGENGDAAKEKPDNVAEEVDKKETKEVVKEETKEVVEEVTEIRIQILLNQSINSIAKAHHTSPATVRQIRDHETYQDIPWPEEIGRYSQPDNSQFVRLMLLSLPMSDIEDEHKALKEDYHLVPDYRSVLLLRAVRRAMAGDAELAAVLMLLGGYETDLSRIIEEESVIVNTLYKKKPIDSFTFEN